MDINKLIHIAKGLGYNGPELDDWVEKALKHEQDGIHKGKDEEREIAKYNAAMKVLRQETLILQHRAECLKKVYARKELYELNRRMVAIADLNIEWKSEMREENESDQTDPLSARSELVELVVDLTKNDSLANEVQAQGFLLQNPAQKTSGGPMTSTLETCKEHIKKLHNHDMGSTSLQEP